MLLDTLGSNAVRWRPAQDTNLHWLEHTFRAEYDYHTGAMTDLVDEQHNVGNPSDDIVTTFVYGDSLDRLTKVVADAGTGGFQAETNFVYTDTPGSISALTKRDQYGPQDGLLQTTTHFDGLGRVRLLPNVG
jgi:hypothetical protein